MTVGVSSGQRAPVGVLTSAGDHPGGDILGLGRPAHRRVERDRHRRRHRRAGRHVPRKNDPGSHAGGRSRRAGSGGRPACAGHDAEKVNRRRPGTDRRGRGASSQRWDTDHFADSSVEFVTGKGSAGTGNPRRSQIGSQPSPRFHSTSRLAGTSARTAALCRV